MKKGLNIFVGIVIFLAIMIAGGAFYTVDETQQVVLTQFGELVGEVRTPGLHFKVPFVQKVNYFDNRILQWDGDANQIPTKDKRFIWVDTTARWRIVDPLKFMRSMRTEVSAQTRLDDILDAKTRAVISSHVLVDTVRDSNRLLQLQKKSMDEGIIKAFGKTVLQPTQFGREALRYQILELATESIKDYGIELVDLKFKRINYVDEVRNKVYDTMISERERAIERFLAEGQGKKAEIEGQIEKELKIIDSDAYRKAQEIKGKADAEAIKIYAQAYNKDPDFYAFMKTLETYRESINKDTTLILSTENDFFEYLGNKKISLPQF